MNDEWTAESETEILKLYEQLKRKHQGEDQSDIIAAFEADTLPPGHLRNTKGFEPT